MIIDSDNLRTEINTGLTKVICHLYEYGSIRAKHIPLLSGRSTAATTGLLDRGEDLGLLVRKPVEGDRRSLDIDLTPLGVATVESLKPQKP